MPADPVEIELKLEYDPADRERLVALLLAAAGESSIAHPVSTYFDTPACDLRRAGYTLRVRREGRRHVQTVKATGGPSAGLFERTEWERPVRGNRPDLDGGAGPLAGVIGRELLEQVAPLFVTDVTRSLFVVDDPRARIETALDEGEVRAGTRAAPLDELELELRGDAPQALFDLARNLNEMVPLRLGVRSKSERGYALAAGERRVAVKAEPIPLEPDAEVDDAFRTIAQACIRQLCLNEALLIESGNAEALHQARVALRRLRAAFALHKPLFEGDRQAELLMAELRWLAAELGEVRNLDVLIVRCADERRATLADARAEAFAHVRAELAGARTRLLMIDLVEWLAIGAWRSAPAHPRRLHRPVGPFAGAILAARAARLARKARGLAGLDSERRHRVRIDAKKLRYAAEFFAALYTGGKARHRHARFVAALEKLQDLLGELNDLAVGPALLESLGLDPHLPHAGRHARAKLPDRAEKALNAWADTKPFW